MAVTFVAVNSATGQTASTTTTAGAASITSTLPTGTAIGDRVFVFVAASNTSGTTPASWTALFKDVQVGVTGTAPGSGVGRRYISAYYRDRDTAWTMPAFTLTSATQNSHALGVVTLRKDAAETWNAPTFTAAAQDTTDGTGYSVTSPSWTTATGGYVFSVTGLTDNVTSGTPTGTATGMTLGTRTERIDGGVGTGNIVRLVVADAPITAGGTGTITRTATLSAASQGGTAWLQQTVTAPTPNPKADTFIEAFDGTALDARWSYPGWTVANSHAVSGGQLSLPTNLAYHYLHAASEPLDLVGSSFIWGVTGFGLGSATSDLLLALAGTPDDTPGTRLSWVMYDSGDGVNVTWQARMGGTTPLTSGILAPTALRYVRIREASGTVYWDSSADGVTWVQRHSATATISLGNLYPTFSWGSWAAPSTTFVISGINETVATGTDVQSSASSAAGAVDTATATLTAARSASSDADAVDVASTTLDAQRVAASAAGASDTASATLGAQRAATSAAGAVDTASVTLDATRGASSNAAAVDTAATTLTAARVASSSAGASDSATWTLTGPAGTVTVAGTATLAEGDATSTQVVIPVPAGAAVGEYLLAHVTHSSTGVTPPSIAAPTGWTKIVQADGEGSTSQGTAVFYRPVVASEPASYTFPTNPTPGRVTGIMVRLAGVHATTQLDTAAVTATSIATTNPIIVPALTTVTSGAMTLYAASINAATAGDIVAPAEVTLLTKATGTGRRAGLYSEARPAAGSTGTRTFSHTSATQIQWAVIGVAFRPAAGAAGANLQSSASSTADVTDSASTTLVAARTASSDAGTSDTATVAVDYVRTTTSGAGAVDTVSTTLVAARAASSDAAATDSHSWTMSRGLDAAASSSAAVTDSVSTTLTASRSATDVAGATDTASTALTAARAASDAAGAVDTAGTSLTAVRSATSAAGATDSATWSLIGPDRYIDWGGHNWWVRKGTLEPPTQSNPNTWGNGVQNVEILPDGKLKLAITQVNGVWTAAEVDQNDANIVGYGRFRWVYDIDAVNLDRQPVLGLFMYDQTATLEQGKREMDIEVTRWGVTDWQHKFWYSVHPTNTNNEFPAQGQPIVHRQGSHMVSAAGPYTSDLVWQPGQVYFRTTAADGSVVGEHVVTEGVQAPGSQKLAMNLWLNNGTGGPSNGQPVTAVIHSFEHTPGVTHALVPAAQFVEDFADVQGWTTLNGAAISGGSLTVPTLASYAASAYSGHVLDMRGSSTRVELASVPVAGQEVFWHTLWDANNAFTMYVSGGTLVGRRMQGGVAATTTGVAYSPTAHRHLRITESAGTVSFHTSPNGTAWTLLGSLAHTLSTAQLSAMRQQFDAGGWETATQPFTVARVGAPAAVDVQSSATSSAGATDSVTTALVAVRSATSNAGATDAASTTLDAQRAAVDAAPVTDSVSTTLDAQRSTVSTAGAVDSVAVAIDYVRTASSGAGATDSAGASLTAVRSATSAAGAVDAASTVQDYGRTASSSAGAVDSAARTLDAVRTASSTADARDEINISAAGQTTVTATSSAGATDSVAVIRNVVITVSSGAGAVDSVATAADVRRSASSAAGAVDAASTSAAVGIDRSAVSTAGATDSVTTSVDHGRGAVSTAGASDNVTWEMARVITRFAVSGAGAVDDIAAIRDVHRTAVSTAGATDTVVTGGGLQITATSEAGATDSVTWTISTFRGAYQVTYSKLRSAVTRGRLRSASTSRHEET